MKHLKSFSELMESSSAGSQETNDVLPFKYTKVYDPRIGYNKNDFVNDLDLITATMEDMDKEDLGVIIKSLTGSSSIDSIHNLRSRQLNQLIHSVEDFLDSKADFELQMYPDGYVLCFENLKVGNKKYDIYYSPAKNNLKIVHQTGAAIEPEYISSVDDFKPKNFGIDKEDFEKTIGKANHIFKRKGISDKTPQ